MSEDAAVAEAESDPNAEAEAEAGKVAETAESEGQADQSEKPSESSTEKKDDGIQARIDELTRHRREAERERDAIRAELEQVRQQAKPAPVEPGKSLADFDYDEAKFADYVEQVADQKAETRFTERQAEAQAQALRGEFTQREAGFAKDNPDYYQVAHYAPISEQVAGLVMNAEKGPEIAYYLGKNPDVASQISSLPVHLAAIEIGRIEAGKLASEPSKTNAPPPPAKIAAKSSPTAIDPKSADGDRLSITDWMKRRQKQMS